MKRDKEFYEKFDLGELNKKELLEDSDLAIGLAKFNEKFQDHPLAQELEVLKLTKKRLFDWFGLKGGEVAYHLAKKWNGTWWNTPAAQTLEVLSLCNGKVASKLAECSINSGWALTPAAQDMDVLRLGWGDVAWKLSMGSDENGWALTPAAQKKEVLRLSNKEVAWQLARNSRKSGWERPAMLDGYWY